MAEAPAAGDKDDKAAAPAKSNKLLLVIALVFNVLMAGGLAYVLISGQHAAAPAKGAVPQARGAAHESESEAEEEDEEEGAPKKGAFGPLITVGTFVVNLGDPANKSFLKVSVNVEAANEEAKGKVEAALIPIKSHTLQFLSGLAPEQVIGETRIAALQTELLKQLQAALGKKLVKRVYFSEFVVQ